MQCPPNSFRYNGTLCACNPGYLGTAMGSSCQLFSGFEAVELRSGVDYSIPFPETIFDFDSIKRFTQSQAVFLEATLAMLFSWLFFCLVVRMVGPLSDGRSPWFKIRWWISRLDVCFATRHWLDDQKVVMKRKTELGGVFSVASWILFVGLLSTLLYQVISRRSVEVHTIRAANGPDLASFLNDLEFNITAISGMSCSNLRGLGALVTGNPGTLNFKVTHLSTFANYSCLNTSRGPTISLKCISCQLIPDTAYIPWQFVDLPNHPATAVGFQFKLTARSHDDKKHLSSVSGTVKNGSIFQPKQVTFRGADPNIFKFNLFPRHYRNVHDLRLIQPLFHDFIPGSYASDANQLRASLESSNSGLVNATLYVNFLSDYIVEIDSQNALGPVSFLADLGGIYCFSIFVFFHLMVQCEYRSKKFRHEDTVMRNVRNRRKAQDRWSKVRKYVMYRWGCSSLDDDNTNERNEACCTGFAVDSLHRSRSLHNARQRKTLEMLSFTRNVKQSSDQHNVPDLNEAEASKCLMMVSSNPVKKALPTVDEHEHEELTNVENGATESTSGSVLEGCSRAEVSHVLDDLALPPPPLLQCPGPGEINISDFQKSFQDIYDFNVILRDKVVSLQSILRDLSVKKSSISSEIGLSSE